MAPETAAIPTFTDLSPLSNVAQKVVDAPRSQDDQLRDFGLNRAQRRKFEHAQRQPGSARRRQTSAR